MAEVAPTDTAVSEALIVDNEEDESKVRGSLPHARMHARTHPLR
jgi:hypothetical protein